MVLIDHPLETLAPGAPVTPAAPPDERAARHTLLAQIARLERELADAVVAAFPYVTEPAGTTVVRGPRMLALGELERVRDDLAERVGGARQAVRARADREAAARELLEDMLHDPRAHKWAIVSGHDLGERVCAYQVRPRLGLIGMLMGWWRVKVSSGCPLRAGRRSAPRGSSMLPAWAAAAASA